MIPENDLVITYGYGDTPGWISELLFEEKLVPVATPAYLETLNMRNQVDLSLNKNVTLLKKLTLLEYDRLAPDWINWQTWIDKTGTTSFQGCTMEPCRNYAQAIGAALDAKGLALGSRGLIDDELNSGRLCLVGDIELSSGRAYYLSHPRKKSLSPAAEMLRQKLLSN